MSEVEVLGSMHNGAAAAARTQAWDGVCEHRSSGERRGGQQRACVYCQSASSERAVYSIRLRAGYEPRAARHWWTSTRWRCHTPAQPWLSNTLSPQLLHVWPILSRNPLCGPLPSWYSCHERCGLMIRSTRNSPATQCTRPDKTLVLHRQGVVQHNTARRLQGQRIPV